VKKIFLTLLFILVTSSLVQGKLKTEAVEYSHGNTKLEGYLAYDDTQKGKRPGVIVVHEWKGLGQYAKTRAEQLAELGYIAFAIDMYGKGVRVETHEEASKLAGIYRKDRELMRSRAQAGLEVLKAHKLTDSQNIAAIGYCFGGGTVLEMARSGADLSGVVSFHGTLDTPNPEDAKNIKGKVLVCHGGDDRFIPTEQITAFQDEMRSAEVDWQFITYGGAVHSFTVKEAGSDPKVGTAYNEDADRRSWKAMKDFFVEIFQ
jgi:dienelactone hydrolase